MGFLYMVFQYIFLRLYHVALINFIYYCVTQKVYPFIAVYQIATWTTLACIDMYTSIGTPTERLVLVGLVSLEQYGRIKMFISKKY